MKPQKFIQSFKCECFQPYNYCTCPQKIVASKVLIENICDTADSLIEVMTLCGIHLMRAKLSYGVIIYYFLHFEEIIHRIDSVPRKRLNKEDLLHDLGRKCRMNRIDAQIAYSIIKRAFRAFYFGTGLGGISNHFLSDQLTHSSECLWVHAAQRTAQVYSAYMGVLYAVQKNLERKIKVIYKQLYDRICERNKIYDDQECTCVQCIKRINKESLKIVTVTTGIHKIHNPYEAIYRKERKEFMLKEGHERSNSQEISIEDKKKICSCPALILTSKDYMYEDNAESSYIGCSQGPFDCRWFPISKEEYEADDAEIKITLPEEFPCPPCSVDEECESICECTCEDCKCTTDVVCDEPKSSNDDDDGYDDDDDSDADADADANIAQSVIKDGVEEDLEVESEMEFKCCRFPKGSSSESDDEDSSN